MLQDDYAKHKLIISSNLDFEDGLPQKGERTLKGKISLDNHTLLNKTLTSLHYFGPKGKSARTFQVSATRFWNSLPNEITCSSSLEILKKSLYKYFFESYKDVHHFTIALAIILYSHIIYFKFLDNSYFNC